MGADGHAYRCCLSVSIGFVYRSNLSARVVSLGVLSRARPRELAAGMNAGRFGAALSGQRSDIFPPSFPQVLPTGKRLDGQECPTPGAEPLSCAYHDFSCGVVIGQVTGTGARKVEVPGPRGRLKLPILHNENKTKDLPLCYRKQTYT